MTNLIRPNYYLRKRMVAPYRFSRCETPCSFRTQSLPLTVGRDSSVQLINSLGEDKTIVVVAQREARWTHLNPPISTTSALSLSYTKSVKDAQPEPVRFCRGPGEGAARGVLRNSLPSCARK